MAVLKNLTFTTMPIPGGKPQYEKVCQDLKDLLDKRNMLVHAETWEGAFHGKPYQPYRVAIVEGNLDYLDDLEHAEHGDNVFGIDRVREATKACIRLNITLKAMRDELIADAEPQVPEPEESAWPSRIVRRLIRIV